MTVEPAQVIEDLSSGVAARYRAALDLASSFVDGQPENFSLQDKLEVVNKFMVLDHKELIRVWQDLLHCQETAIRDLVREQVVHYLPVNERFDFLEACIKLETINFQVLKMIQEWGSFAYCDQLVDFLSSEDAELVGKTIEVLSGINFNAYFPKFLHYGQGKSRELRLVVSREVTRARSPKVPFAYYETSLRDPVREVRKNALTCGMKFASPEWVAPLRRFLMEFDVAEDTERAIRILGQVNTSEVIGPLVNYLYETGNQSLRWACLQALGEVSLELRLDHYEDMLKGEVQDDWLHAIELLGQCEGARTFRILKGALDKISNPGIRALIAGAMGTCGHPECEAVLLAMMNSSLTEMYAAAAALKTLIKDKVLVHFEQMLGRADLEDVVKQIVIQHIGESSGLMKVPESLVRIIEGHLANDNENMRYLSLQAIAAIGSPTSLPVLLDIAHTEWTAKFGRELDAAVKNCSRCAITHMLEKMCQHGPGSREFNWIRKFLARNPLVMHDADLELLSSHAALANWAWDEELLPCIKATHDSDKSFVWRQFSRPVLHEKLCCFIAKGFDATSPSAREMVDSDILINCFSRYQSPEPLLALGQLMSKFPRIELLTPLIKFAESARGETAPVFRQFVRRILEGLNSC